MDFHTFDLTLIVYCTLPSKFVRVVLSGAICINVQVRVRAVLCFFLNFFIFCTIEYLSCKMSPHRCLVMANAWLAIRYLCSTAVNRPLIARNLTFKHLVLCCPASKLDWPENSVNTQFGFINGYYT